VGGVRRTGPATGAVGTKGAPRSGASQFPTEGPLTGGTLVPGATELLDPAAQESTGNHDPWNPKGTRAGRCTVATGGPAKEVASRITRSLESVVAS
jgi:hypothetical protein